MLVLMTLVEPVYRRELMLSAVMEKSFIAIHALQELFLRYPQSWAPLQEELSIPRQ